jgi:hypothetical protein
MSYERSKDGKTFIDVRAGGHPVKTSVFDAMIKAERNPILHATNGISDVHAYREKHPDAFIVVLIHGQFCVHCHVFKNIMAYFYIEAMDLSYSFNRRLQFFAVQGDSMDEKTGEMFHVEMSKLYKYQTVPTMLLLDPDKPKVPYTFDCVNGGYSPPIPGNFLSMTKKMALTSRNIARLTDLMPEVDPETYDEEIEKRKRIVSKICIQEIQTRMTPR